MQMVMYSENYQINKLTKKFQKIFKNKPSIKKCPNLITIKWWLIKDNLNQDKLKAKPNK